MSKTLDERRNREIQRDFSRHAKQLLALKTSSNNELFEHIKNTFAEQLNDREFKLMNIVRKTSQKTAILYGTKLRHRIRHKTSVHRLKD